LLFPSHSLIPQPFPSPYRFLSFPISLIITDFYNSPFPLLYSFLIFPVITGFYNSSLTFPNCTVPIPLSSRFQIPQFPYSHSPLPIPVSPIPLFPFPLGFSHSPIPSHSRFLLLSPPATCSGNAVTWQKKRARVNRKYMVAGSWDREGLLHSKVHRNLPLSFWPLSVHRNRSPPPPFCLFMLTEIAPLFCLSLC